MPLLRRKPFIPEEPPADLDPDEEILFCDLTGEVYRNYDAFYERVILCNSLLWTCERTGRSGLTFKEAKDSEQNVARLLDAFPRPVASAVLTIVHHTRRGKLADLCDEIYEYLRCRYVEGESIEYRRSDQWHKGTIVSSPVLLSSSVFSDSPFNSSKHKIASPKCVEKDSQADSLPLSPIPCSPMDNKGKWPDAKQLEYEVEVKDKGESVTLKGKNIRRQKGIFVKDTIRLFIRKNCYRSTASSDDGFWKVLSKFIEEYQLGPSSVDGPLAPNTPAKYKNKRKRTSEPPENDKDKETPKKKKKTEKGKSETKTKGGKKRKSKEKEQKKGKKKKKEQLENKEKKISRKGSKTEPKPLKLENLTEEERKRVLEEIKLKKKQEREEERKRKFLEKEEDKKRKKIEREKEREKANKVKELELQFLKKWSKNRDDLKLEDLKPLPILKGVDSKLPTEHFGSILMVTEFLLAFGQLYQIEESIPYEVSSEIVEEALFEHDAEGKYYDILKFLLQSFLRVSQEENDEEEEEQSSDGNDTPPEMEDKDEKRSESYLSAPSAGATVAAAWPMLHQGQTLSQLTMDPFTLSEILRLHILSSGVKIGGALTLWQRRGGFQFSDDPCVHFRHQESVLMKALSSDCIYDLDPTWKLRILCVLCDQLLTLVTTRDYIEDAFDKIKELKKQLRELQYAEHRRRKTEAAERYKRRLNERAQVKEEILRRKKEKAERSNEGGKDKTTSEAVDSKGKAKPSPVSSKVSGDSTPNVNEKLEDDEPTLTLVKLTDITEEEEALEKQKRGVFLRKESELKKELVKFAAINGQSPLGRDRALRCYWALAGSNRLFVEGGNHDVNLLLSSADEDYISDGEGDDDEEETEKENRDGDISQADIGCEKSKTEVENPTVPQVTLQEVNEARANKEALLPLLLERYKCDHALSEGEILQHSKILERIRDDVCLGVDPNEYEYKAEKEEWWQTFDTAEKVEMLLKSLNERGVREGTLKTNLKLNLDWVVDGVERCASEAACRDTSLPKVKPSKGGDNIDKTLFKSMNDFLEANLRDQILDFEDRLWNGSLGVIKVEDRGAWRRKIEDGLAKLIVRVGGSSTECNISTEDVQDEEAAVMNGVSSLHTSGKERGMHDDDFRLSEDQKPYKSLALKVKDEFAGDKREGCTTPTTVGTPTINPVIKELGQALLQVEKGIERKFLKPPLGEDEERKKERIKEMFDAAKTEFEEMNLKVKQEKKRKRQSNGLDKTVCDLTNGEVKGEIVEKTGDDDNTSVCSSASEELKKERTCLERWETSLKSACNFSQLFIHLNTLDQSVMWDKSVLNARCKKCRRKGDAEQMLLCDGCDRGFHIYCLVPPMKQIPQGDWFCQDCRPKEPRRSARRRKPSKIVLDSDYENGEDGESGETEDWDHEEGSEESDASSDNTEEDEDDDSDDEDDEETENSSDEYSEEQEDEEDTMEQEEDETPTHNDYCSICAGGGTLLCCDTCHRAYHTLCTYPPMKKVPKGSWSCQVCTQAESELPKSRRVVTIEKLRGKEVVNKGKGTSTRTSARSKSVPQRSSRIRTPVEDRGRTSLAKKRKRAQSASPGVGLPRKVTRRSKADTPVSGKRSKAAPKSPAKVAKGVRRSSNFSFGRYERRQCSKLLEELMSQDDADPFLAPVDTKLVPDYRLYIDHPMDFGTIKRNINAAHYNTLDEFLDDVRLVFKNCETYNAPRSAIARAGTRLSLHFEQRLLDMELCSR